MKTIIVAIITLFICSFAQAGEVTKQQSFHYSVTENGNIQVRMITEYVKDGKVVDKKYSQPMTPADTSKMDGWDQKSKDIVSAITDKDVKAAFETEHQTPTGIGIEEVVTYDRVIDDLGRVLVRRITRIYNDGEVVSKKFHRSWIMPGDDTKGEDVMSKAVADKLHTQAVKDTYDAKMSELSAK